jgi:hypothetical protein
MAKHTEDMAIGTLMNPYYAVTIKSSAFRGQQNKSVREDWLLLNTQLMNEIGAELWLNELLDVLSMDDDVFNGHDIVRPNLTVRLSRSLEGEHEPLVTRERWVETNAKLVKEMGSRVWLDRLLDVLEG